MIFVYRIMYLPALLVSLPYYLARMFRRGGYGSAFKQRFGFYDRLPQRADDVKRIWIQAVSVGEVNAVTPLIRMLHESGEFEVVLTTTTSTGYAIACEKLKPLCLSIGYFPLDFWFFSSLAWSRIQPDSVVLMEGELWPEHCYRAKKNGVPLLLINARMSDRSFRRYLKIGYLAKWIVQKPDAILAGTEQDAERFRQLGGTEAQVCMVGNMKFDVASGQCGDENVYRELMTELNFVPLKHGAGEPLILLGSSTWDGEESMLLRTFQDAVKMGIDCRLLLVPRHAERRHEICALLERQEHTWHLRSRGKTPLEPVMIIVADTTGELNRLTLAADVVFVGKSLPPHEGGQTPIEVAAHGKAIVYGNRMSNFRDICQSLEANNAAIQVESADSAMDVLLNLLQDGERRKTLGKAASEWHSKHRGATQKIFARIRSY